MRCAWTSYVNILPVWMREEVDKRGRGTLQELRLRIGLPPELVMDSECSFLRRTVTADDLTFCINVASKYSPWASATISDGYITADGGHRIGICGSCTVVNGRVTGINVPSSLCLRVARDFTGISGELWKIDGSVLIIGRPGCGKTTLLRDLVRQISNNGTSSICVIDEKREIFPAREGVPCFPYGKRTDILSGCSKLHGIEAALRNMGPGTIAVDEITASEDCCAMIHAGWCGVRLIATAHAGSKQELFSRPVYRPVLESRLFGTLVIMYPNKSWSIERLQ